MNEKTSFLPIIGALRGLAALGVALFHIVNSPTGFEIDPDIRSFFVHGAHGVQVFFVISGVVIPLSLIRKNYRINKFGRFIWKRTLRIEPTYLVFLGFSLVWIASREYVLNDGGIPFPSPKAILYNIVYLVPFTKEDWVNPVFWTLGIELQFYMLCALILGFVRSFGFYPLLSLPFATCFITHIMPKGFVFEWIGFFVLGFYLALFIDGKISKQQLTPLVMVQLLCLGWSHGAYLAFIGALTVLAIIINPLGGQWKPLQFLGNQSYSLYLVHSLVGTVAVNVAMRLLPHTQWAIHWAIVLFAVSLSIFCAQILYLVVEKPTLEKSKRISL